MPYVHLSGWGGALDHYNFSQFTGLAFWRTKPKGIRITGDGDYVILNPGTESRVMIYKGWNAGLYKVAAPIRPGIKKFLAEVTVGNLASKEEAETRAPSYFIEKSSDQFTLGMPQLHPMKLEAYKSKDRIAVYTCERLFSDQFGVGDVFIAIEWTGDEPIYLDWVTPYYDNKELEGT